MRTAPPADKRKIGVHVSLDLDTLGRVDEAAARVGLTRSQLLRQMILDWTEDQEAAAWLARAGETARAEETIPWDRAKAELGL